MSESKPCVSTSEADFWANRSGYRVYRESILERLEFVKKAQTLGFSLEEIRRIIEENKAGKCPCAKVCENVRERLKEIDKHLRDLRRYRNELAATLASWDEQETEAEGNTCSLIESFNGKNRKSHSSTGFGIKKKPLEFLKNRRIIK